jgi:hypothetical protein
MCEMTRKMATTVFKPDDETTQSTDQLEWVQTTQLYERILELDDHLVTIEHRIQGYCSHAGQL